MKYHHTSIGIFKARPNRFIAHVYLEDKLEIVHVKNTGRCKELLIPGVKVVLEMSDNPARKTKYDLIGVWKEGIGLINMDSQAPNKVVGEWLAEQGCTYIKPEYKYGDSRLDFYFERGDRKALLEVKGVTLERDGICYFPDAPTLRGVKHIHELTKAVDKGYDCYIAFVIQMAGADQVYPNRDTHPEFGQALDEAQAAGVKVLCLGCKVTEDTLEIDRASEGL